MAARILFLISAMIEGGAERVASQLCSRWARDGHEVILMPTFSGRGDCLYEIDPRVKLEYLADRVRSRRKDPLNAVRRLLALRRAMLEIDPDVVVSFLANVNVAAVMAGRGTGLPIILSERSYPPRDKLAGVFRLLRRLCYRWADCVVAPTRDTAEWITRHCPGSKVVIIPNPVSWPLNDGKPVILPDTVLPRARKILLAAGRLSPEKAFEDLLGAFAEVADDFLQWDLVILGEGPERFFLESRRSDLKLTGRVFLPGRAANMTQWYERADIVSLTSRYEGFPNVLAEAMAAGTPVVAVDCLTGPRDIVREGIDGLLIPPRSGASGLAAGLKKLMGDDDLRHRMGENARSVRDRFSLAEINKLWAKAMELET